MKLTELTLVDCDDWVALYVDGKLTQQGHGRARAAGVDLLAFGASHSPFSVKLIFGDPGWIERVVHYDGMPDQLSDVKGSGEALRPDLALQ